MALVSAAKDPDEAVKVLTEAAGSTAAEARMRLAPEPPALLARLDDAAADELALKLRKAGLAALAIDARVPESSDRFQARKFTLEKDALQLETRAGEAASLAWGDFALILRAQRTRRAETDKTETIKRLSIGSAVLTGGLKMTSTKTSVVRSAEEQSEQLLLIYTSGGNVFELAETVLDWSGLGSLQPSRTANFLDLTKRIREMAKGARYDDRLVRLGRRSLPFGGLKGEQRVSTAKSITLHTDTAGTVDILAELLWQAHRAALI